MARAEDAELIDRFEEFYRSYYRNEIGELAQKYPNEQRSLYVDWNDLYRFDPDMADDFIAQPGQMRDYAEEALRLYDLPVDVKLGSAHVRVRNLSERTDIRDIRADHVGNLVAVQGIVRKATDVRPKMRQAAFECQRCGTMTRIPQSDGEFQEPHECQGCERQGPFAINFDQSEFVDAQKIRVQESPEGLRGGETPQAIDVNIEDDITGKVTAGDHVTVVGILRLEQQGNQQEKSPIFDFYMEGTAVTIEDEQFEEMDITEADKKRIIELSNDPDIYEKMVGSMAPSIYGYEEQKEAIILQLFSGVRKNLPDGSRIRGDLHILLIGDPGTGKCVSGDTRVTLADGAETEIRELVESNLDDPTPIDDGVYDEVNIEVPSMAADGTLTTKRATKVWKRDAPDRMYRVRTRAGREVVVTPSHPLFAARSGGMEAVVADDLTEGEFIAVPRSPAAEGDDAKDVPVHDSPRAADGGTHAGSTSRDDQPLAEGDVGWDRIDAIERVEPDDDWVYDLEIEGTHNYLTNNIVSHNSQILQYVKKLSPRSVYTSGKGSSAAGLCVTGDTMVHTDDGFQPIRDLVTPEVPTPVDSETAVEMELNLPTFDRDRGTVTTGTSSHAWRMPEKPCRRLETSHGKELEASVNTPVLVCGDDGIEWREIGDVTAGDHVAVPRYDDINRADVPVREYLELTTEKVRLTDESVAFLREALVEEFGTLRDAASALDLSEDFIYLHLKNRHVPQEKLDRMLDAVGATRDDVAFERLMVRHGSSITVPETFDEDLMYLLGLLVGDGDIRVNRRGGNRGMVRISNGNEALLERAADIFETAFDVRPEIERQEDRVPCIRVSNVTIARLFANVGMETPKESLSLAPAFTVAEHADAFLRGLMDADGSVSVRENGGSSVLLSTISEPLAQQVQLMLETYGIRASVRERDRRGTTELSDGQTITSNHVQQFVELYGADIDRYAETIGFESEAKSRALEQATATERRYAETLPVGGALAAAGGPAGAYYQNVHRGDNPGRERARQMLTDIDLGPVEDDVREVVDASLRWDEVVAAVDTGRKEVFDLTVPGTNNFLGNGIVTHNTAAAVRDDFGEGQQWSLEAGALVLADQGVAAVDELDKMRCVAGDTLVHLGDGQVRRIGAVADEAATDGTVEELANGRTIRDVDLDAWTMTDDGRIVRRPITAVHEYEAPSSLTDVTLATGERLTTTDDHPFFVREDGDRVERAAGELDAGDWVYVPRSIPSAASDGGTETYAANDDGHSVEGTEPDTGPTPAFGAVLGYLSGDGNVYSDRSSAGHGIRFTNAEEELRRDFEQVCREAFDAEPTRPPSERRDDGVETVRLFGKEYAKAVLDAGMNLETYEDKAFPTAVSDGSRATKAAFLRALADSEGNVDTATGHVRIYSASYELLLGAKELLLEFDITGQLQVDEQPRKRDVYALAITDAESLAAFARHIGFTLDRKRRALETVVDAASGDRTILDVIPQAGSVLADCREQLRLYQRECGIDDATYCNFERGERVFDAFRRRKAQATADVETLDDGADGATPLSWERLETIKERYHVSQAELAETTEYSQSRISHDWGSDSQLRAMVHRRLATLVADVAATDLSELRELVRGDVKWRRVESVESVSPTTVEDRVPVLREELGDILDIDPDGAVERARELLATEPTMASWASLRSELDRHAVSFAEIADDLGVASSTVSRWVGGVVETDRFEDVRSAAATRIADVRTDVAQRVDAIDAARTPKVYDLTVEGTHNFVANGMVVHNSEDQSAMHQALEQQEISISKAGINATLKSRCSLLGAANPIHGRFDEYEAMAEQIDLDPPLISRFDLIFTVTDKPNEEEDRALADHIIETNYAGELFTHRESVPTSNVSEEEVNSVGRNVEPAIETELLRKYVAHAKRSCFPTMTEEAKAAIREFYVDLRLDGQGSDNPIPITARKLEALVRLAEASARVRLSDTVEKEDAERVIDIVRSSLEDVGVDPETGEFDADIIESGTSKSQRDRIKNIKGIIEELEDEYEDGAPIEEIYARAEEVGMDREKAEHEIDKLRTKGELYEPVTDHLRTV